MSSRSAQTTRPDTEPPAHRWPGGRWLLLGGTAALALLIAVGAAVYLLVLRDDDSAGDVDKARYELLSDSRYAEAWALLHPSHQAVVSEEAFVRCGVESETRNSPLVDAVEVLKETEGHDDDMYGIGPVDYTLVEIRLLRGSDYIYTNDQMIKVNGTWRWTMSQPVIDAFQVGCP